MYLVFIPSINLYSPLFFLVSKSLRHIFLSLFIKSGPNVKGRLTPILKPVHPFSLWLAVTMATDLQSKSY